MDVVLDDINTLNLLRMFADPAWIKSNQEVEFGPRRYPNRPRSTSLIDLPFRKSSPRTVCGTRVSA